MKRVVLVAVSGLPVSRSPHPALHCRPASAQSRGIHCTALCVFFLLPPSKSCLALNCWLQCWQRINWHFMFPVHLTAADVPFPAKLIGVLHRIFEQGLCQQCGTVPIRATLFYQLSSGSAALFWCHPCTRCPLPSQPSSRSVKNLKLHRLISRFSFERNWNLENILVTCALVQNWQEAPSAAFL